MNSRIKEALRNICCNNGWCYAVFWRVNRRNSMLLTLEDAYYEDQFETVLSKMLQRVHMLGEGIIGHAGSSGNHRWIFSDTYCQGWNPTGLVADQDIFQGNSEFLQQFLYGIKTIAVISVAPHGVVQFGSTEEILEKFEFVNHIRCLFRKLQSVDDSFPPKNFRTAMNNVIYNDYDPSGVVDSSVNTGSSCPNYGNNNNSLYDDVKHEMIQVTQSPMVLPQSSSFTSALQARGVNPMVNNPPFYLNNPFRFPGIDPQVRLSAPSMQLPPVLSQCTNNLTAKNPTMTSWNTEGSPLTSLEQQLLSGVGIQEPSNAFSANTNPLVTGGNTFQNFQGDGTLTSLYGVDVLCSTNLNDFSQSLGVASTSLVGGDVLNGIPVNPSTSLQNSVGDPLSTLNVVPGNPLDLPHLPTDDDFFSNLALDFSQIQGTKGCWEDILLPLGSGSRSTLSTGTSECISELDIGSMMGSQKGLFSDFGLEQLLDGLNGKSTTLETKPSSEDQLSTTTISRSSTSLHNNQVLLGVPEKTTMQRSQTDIVPKPRVGLWIDDSYSINTETSAISQSKKSDEPPKPTKKRARPGESTRPRPKDRQQIQDRVKELREIVPNGAKCSIDALLDRTIKHMLFLQSVTKYADKLKQADEPKMIGNESGVVLKDNSSGGAGGATWAYEVGGKTMLCPIIVEDLAPPGQMLVEMLCEERGFFLEIADIIRGFGLTILKGMMEAREDKIWARFIVEANRDITRMDIFLSLVGLLQQTATSGTNHNISQPSNDVTSGIPQFNNYQQSHLPPVPIGFVNGLH